MVVTLGALLGDVPHTRAVRVTGTATDPDADQRPRAHPLAVRGPDRHRRRAARRVPRRPGMRSASLWAPVPHYVATPPNPPATRALLERLGQLAELRARPARTRPARRPLAGAGRPRDPDNDEVTSYVRELEVAGRRRGRRRARHRARRPPRGRRLGARAPTTSPPRSSSSSATRTAAPELMPVGPGAAGARPAHPRRRGLVHDRGAGRHRRPVRHVLARQVRRPRRRSRSTSTATASRRPRSRPTSSARWSWCAACCWSLGLLTRPAALLLAAQPGRRHRHRRSGRRRHVPPRGRPRRCWSAMLFLVWAGAGASRSTVRCVARRAACR